MLSGFYIPPAIRNACAKNWLDSYRQCDMIYGDFLFNHLTHSMVVMSNIGLSEDDCEKRMRDWDSFYKETRILDPPRSVQPDMPEITSRNWKMHLGHTRGKYNYNYPAYLAYFDDQVRRHGCVSTVKTHFPHVMNGMAACAVHPIIHLGFGLEAANNGMVAEGLAGMCGMGHTLGAGAALWADYSSDDPMGFLKTSLAYLERADAENLHATAAKAAKTPEYMQYKIGSFQRILLTYEDVSLPLGRSLDESGPVELPPVSESLTPAVTEATLLIAAAYLASDCEFFVIHGLTSLHATLVIIAHFEDSPVLQREALVHWWRTAVAVLVCQNIPDMKAKIESALSAAPLMVRGENASLSGHVSVLLESDSVSCEGAAEEERFWAASLELSLTSEDEHVAKAVYALWRWSTWPHMPAHAKQLFKAAVINQLRENDKGGPHNNIWFAG